MTNPLLGRAAGLLRSRVCLLAKGHIARGRWMVMLDKAWLIPAFPLVSWLAISFFNRRVPLRRDIIGIFAILLAFLLSVQVAFQVAKQGPISRSVTWAVHGGHPFLLGYHVDMLAALMLVVVTFVSLMVQIYSVGYMHDDIRYNRYYALLSLFTFSMLGLVMADNLLFLFLFWELVGLCSYFLIGHWYEKEEVGAAAMKAFLTTRVGDIAMLVGIMVLFASTGSFRYDTLITTIQNGELSSTIVTVAALLLFAGAVGKSAQFPLHAWLPDAMAGPTPVSALIHAATMVAAGVYLLARIYPLFSASTSALTTIAWVGGFTALFAASIGLVMDDIKKVLAYSTISQLGYMMLGLGSGSLVAGFFHLVTHAFFKALLFLGAGSVIHSANTQNMHQMGGLSRRMPITFITWIIGAVSLAGIPPFSGFYSKEEILATAYAAGHSVPFWMALVAAVFTAFYITRATVLTFLGQSRTPNSDHAHESPATMTLPLLFLAGVAVLAGHLNSAFTNHLLSRLLAPEHVTEFHAGSVVPILAQSAWILGTAVALLLYMTGSVSLRSTLIRVFRPVWVLLKNAYYVDRLYSGVAFGAMGLARSIAEFDRDVIDAVVDGVGGLTVTTSRLVRRLQTGLLQSYALLLVVGLVAALWFLAVA